MTEDDFSRLDDLGEMAWLYVLAKKTGDTFERPVKVGISKSPSNRLKAIQTSTPFKVDIFTYYECMCRDWSLQIEAAFHERHRDKHLHGEWFDIDPSDAALLIDAEFRLFLDRQGCNPELKKNILGRFCIADELEMVS